MARNDLNDLLEAALEYAARGWRVFPVHYARDGQCSCFNPNCKDPGKHPLTHNGFKNATTEDQQIRTWWEHFPTANIGIETGMASGLVVVDIDKPEAKEILRERLGYDITDRLTVKTEATAGTAILVIRASRCPVG